MISSGINCYKTREEKYIVPARVFLICIAYLHTLLHFHAWSKSGNVGEVVVPPVDGPGLDVEPVVGDQRHLIEAGDADQAEVVAPPAPAAGDGRPAGGRQRHVARAGRLDPVDEVDVLHDRVVRPESPERVEETPPQEQHLFGKILPRHEVFFYQPCFPNLIPEGELEILATCVHPSLYQSHRPQEEPAVLVAGLQLKFWRGVVVAVQPKGEGAAADPGGPDRLDDAINKAIWNPA